MNSDWRKHSGLPPILKCTASKRRFHIGRISAFLVGTAILVGASQPKAADQLRAERVVWARLVTPNQDWVIHSDRDPGLAGFIRANTSLDIWKSQYSANPAHLDQLCLHPFIYAKDLRWVRDPAQLTNISEYLRRGGFMCVDACATEEVNPDMEAYLRDNTAIFKRMFPAAEIRKLSETHGVYTCFFKLSRTDIYTPDMGNQARRAGYGLYGVFVEGRMVAIISMYGLQCGWPQTPMRTPGCMKFILNMYVYAMTAGPE
ncbi:MAG: DUF4159 domain-containing protein [Akkermansiaceae bacterium]|nr:DUF4159 domain-containing protein [Verrucomicrobiales bacterium]